MRGMHGASALLRPRAGDGAIRHVFVLNVLFFAGLGGRLRESAQWGGWARLRRKYIVAVCFQTCRVVLRGLAALVDRERRAAIVVCRLWWQRVWFRSAAAVNSAFA
eukprot:jgi/Ulvmu1/9516/UM053_0004.1